MDNYTRNKAASTEEDEGSKPAENSRIAELQDAPRNTLNDWNMRMGDTKFVEVVEMSETKI